jgi:hypothetical protein
MRRLVATGSLMTVLAAALAGATASGAPPPPADSGIRGQVVIGPTCPVQRPGRTCTRPYQARLAIRRVPSETVALRLRSAPDGRFTAHLPAGRYLIQPGNRASYPHGRSQTVTVTADHFTDVTVHFDTGIR